MTEFTLWILNGYNYEKNTSRLDPIAEFRDSRSPLFVVVAPHGTTSEKAADVDPETATPESIAQLTLEQLMDMEITSVSKKPEKLSESSAAIFVITQDDIRRSGATCIPEALRMVPGLQVARIDANKWAISSRGFNGRFTNKLLVLIDGRTVYTPVFSGVFWDVQDTLMEDIERIEVIRGPGSTLWGANAVNGVINIITKKSADTTGGLVLGGGGTEESAFTAFRQGGAIGNDGFYRVYGKFFERDDFVNAAGKDATDEWHGGSLGFRTDWKMFADDSFTLQGDAYQGESGITFFGPMASSLLPPFRNAQKSGESDFAGGNLLGRWQHQFSESSDVSLQIYYDRTERTTPAYLADIDTFDFDAQHRIRLGPRNELIWGLGYRLIHDRLGDSFLASFTPSSRTRQLFSGFLQDEIDIVEDLLQLKVGTKIEHNELTNFEIQPNVRLLLTPNDRQTIWAAVSRAVRTPARGSDLQLIQRVVPAAALGLPPLNGNPATAAAIALSGPTAKEFDAEELVAWELGSRFLPSANLSLDIATFYHVYDQLLSLAVYPTQAFRENNPPPAHYIVPIVPENGTTAETYGVELAVSWDATDRLRIQSAYTLLRMQLHIDPGINDTTSEAAEGQSPRNQVSLRAAFDLTRTIELDAGLMYVDELPALQVPSYFTLDVRLAWKPRPDLEIAVVGQSLLDDRHPEFKPELVDTLPAEVEHGVYGKISWRF